LLGGAELEVVFAATRHPTRRNDGDSHPTSALGAEPRGVERAATAGALSRGLAASGAVGGRHRGSGRDSQAGDRAEGRGPRD
jgi:hypothetical protein